MSGFQNGETLASSGVMGRAVLTTDASPNTAIGRVSINVAIGSLTALNYDFTQFNPGTLSILPDAGWVMKAIERCNALRNGLEAAACSIPPATPLPHVQIEDDGVSLKKWL